MEFQEDLSHDCDTCVWGPISDGTNVKLVKSRPLGPPSRHPNLGIPMIIEAWTLDLSESPLLTLTYEGFAQISD